MFNRESSGSQDALSLSLVVVVVIVVYTCLCIQRQTRSGSSGTIHLVFEAGYFIGTWSLHSRLGLLVNKIQEFDCLPSLALESHAYAAMSIFF